MCISDWSSDVCSSDLKPLLMRALANLLSNSYQYSDRGGARIALAREGERATITVADTGRGMPPDVMARLNDDAVVRLRADESGQGSGSGFRSARRLVEALSGRSEEHTSELQSLMRISYAVFCLKKKT